MYMTEFDRFGPWILEINKMDPVPPLFAESFEKEGEPEYSIKIPRPIERKKANPKMDLYDYLIALYEQDLLVLERNKKEVIKDRIPYEEIEGIFHGENLLQGSLVLLLPNRSVSIPYSTVSSKIMDNVIRHIRNKYQGGGEARTLPDPAQGLPEELSFLFKGLSELEREEEPDSVILLAQPDKNLKDVQGQGWQGFLDRLLGKKLLESLHMSNGRELKIINRTDAFATRRSPVYGRTTHLFPLNKVQPNWDESAEEKELVRLTLKTSCQNTVFYMGKDNPDTDRYKSFLVN
jgi:hypothetical protein